MPRVINVKELILHRGKVLNEMLQDDPPIIIVENKTIVKKSFVIAEMHHYADLATRAGEISLGRSVLDLFSQFVLNRPLEFKKRYSKVIQKKAEELISEQI